MATRSVPAKGIQKAATGIPGFDAMAGGGLPSGQVSLIVGEAGAGKTIFALQTLAGAARERGEAGVFVAFEESARRIAANAASFGWQLPQLRRRKLLFLDARLPGEAVQAGNFELTGLLESVSARARAMKARWVAFDAIDILLDLLPDVHLRRREMSRLKAWLEQSGLTCIITAKSDAGAPDGVPAHRYIAYLAECVIALDHPRESGMPARTLTVRKYRGSTHTDSTVPFLIGAQGIGLAPLHAHSGGYRVYTQRVSTGVPRLDSMLGGGLIRGSGTLVSGAPGTSKTTLAGKFAEAACARGDKVLYVCFDEAGEEIVRNLGSVGIRLARHVRDGKLRMLGIVSRARSAEAQLADVVAQVVAHQPKALVLDPLSAMMQQGGEAGAVDIAYRIVQHCKMRGITLFATSLVSKLAADAETTEMHVSTLADTWIHLSYLARSGERNRALTIVKSRGSGHSNQVRELVLGDKGVTLADTYTEEGEVLMGTLRYQREAQARRKREQEASALALARRQKQARLAELTAAIRAQEAELSYLTRELEQDAAAERRNQAQKTERRTQTSMLRRADDRAGKRK